MYIKVLKIYEDILLLKIYEEPHIRLIIIMIHI